MGEQGPRGLPGVPGDRGEKGEPGRDGMPGRDGLHGLQGERGPPGKDGRDGINGKDGAGFDDWKVSYDGERKLVLQCGSGDRTKEFSVVLPIPIHRGLFKPGATYQRGDEVKFGGHIYRALKDTTARPSEGDEWTLAAHRGRDGRDGKDGAQGPQGAEGRPGRDLTQLGPDGRKW
jgi:integrin beta 3